MPGQLLKKRSARINRVERGSGSVLTGWSGSALTEQEAHDTLAVRERPLAAGEKAPQTGHGVAKGQAAHRGVVPGEGG